MDKTLHDIKAIIKDFHQSLEKLLPLETEINHLITAKETDNAIIENHLDTLLDLNNHGIAKELFITLLEYYKTVNTEGADFYWNEYDKEEE